MATARSKPWSKLGKKVLAVAREMSQLLDEYPPPSSALLLDK